MTRARGKHRSQPYEERFQEFEQLVFSAEPWYRRSYGFSWRLAAFVVLGGAAVVWALRSHFFTFFGSR